MVYVFICIYLINCYLRKYLYMVCVNKCNEVLWIESVLFNKIVMFGIEKIVEVVGVDKL